MVNPGLHNRQRKPTIAKMMKRTPTTMPTIRPSPDNLDSLDNLT